MRPVTSVEHVGDFGLRELRRVDDEVMVERDIVSLLIVIAAEFRCRRSHGEGHTSFDENPTTTLGRLAPITGRSVCKAASTVRDADLICCATRAAETTALIGPAGPPIAVWLAGTFYLDVDIAITISILEKRSWSVGLIIGVERGEVVASGGRDKNDQS